MATLPGRVVYIDPDEIWLADAVRLLVSRDGGSRWQSAGRLSLGLASRFAVATDPGRRLTRAGVHHLLPHQGIAFAGRQIFLREPARPEPIFRRAASVRGSRPLCVATDGQTVYYGEYRGNPDRTPVHVWASRDGGRSWTAVYEFRNVRHVHGVHYDAWTGAFWVTTGDDDEESAIWRTVDGFRTLERVAGGTQQLRVVQLVFTKEHVYFGSDTPRAQNHLYRLHRGGSRPERLQPVGSSVFFGCRVGRHLFFSTAAEPSDVNSTRRAEIWHSADGEHWSLLRSFTRDWWPSRLFQYAQVTFPAGPGDGRRVYFTPQGVVGGGRTVAVSVDAMSKDDETGQL